MSTLIRQAGLGIEDIDIQLRAPRRTVFELADGTVAAVLHDSNSASFRPSSSYGDGSGTDKLYVYTSPDRSTWTLRYTVNMIAATPTQYAYTAELFPDGNIGVVYRTGDIGGAALYYLKINTSTWATMNHEAVLSNSTTITPKSWDLSATDNSAPVIFVQTFHTAGHRVRQRVYARRSDTESWRLTSEWNGPTTSNSETFEATAVAVKGDSATDRYLFYGYTDISASSDEGFHLGYIRYNETTGAEVSAPTTLRTVGAGRINMDPDWKAPPRVAALFASATGEVTWGVTHLRSILRNNLQSGTQLIAGRFNRKTVGVGFNESINPTLYDTDIVTTRVQDSGAFTYANDKLLFHFFAPVGDIFNAGNDSRYHLNYLAEFDGVAGSISYVVGRFRYDTNNGVAGRKIGGGSGLMVTNSRHDVTFHRKSFASDNYDWSVRHQALKALPAPDTRSPSAGSTMISSMPPLIAKVDMDTEAAQTQVKLRWQFATDSGFTTNLRTYIQNNDKFVRVTDTHIPEILHTFVDQLPQEHSLPQGGWFVRGRISDQLGNLGTWETEHQFTVSHPPTAANRTPANSDIVVYGTGSISFRWDFTDTSPDDFQTAREISVVDPVTGSVIYTSGKVLGGSNGINANIAAAHKNKTLQWKVRLWDRDDVAGPWSSWITFILADEPQITVIAPTPNQILVTPRPVITAEITTGTLKKLDQYRIMVKKSSAVIYNSNWIPYTSGGPEPYEIIHQLENSILQNLQAYTIVVSAKDTLGLENSRNIQVTTSWTPPNAPQNQRLLSGSFNSEGAGYVRLKWDDTGRDSKFLEWRIYRSAELLDKQTGLVLETVNEKLLDIVYAVNTAGYQFDDYFAPAGHRVHYRVTQMANSFGEEVESANTATVYADLESDGYWLIDPNTDDPNVRAFKLHLVKADSYTEEFEEAEYTVIGKGRHVDRGSRIGIKGSLEAQIRDTTASSARHKKRRLEKLKRENRHMFLRTPFGDAYWVSIGNIQVTRIPGVGSSEFVDVSLPYSEVAT